ncbi:MAG: hypothetical protein KAS29_01940, partial [Bacteroidales bacterium]|nr:hypothetical protein [Bacteroidales bacterium]
SWCHLLSPQICGLIIPVNGRTGSFTAKADPCRSDVLSQKALETEGNSPFVFNSLSPGGNSLDKHTGY